MSDHDDYDDGATYEDYENDWPDPLDYYDAYDERDEDNDYYNDRDAYDDYYDDERDYDPRDEIDFEDDEEVDLDRLRTYVVGKEYKRFGYYRCDTCEHSWQSAKTYCKYEGEKDGEQVFKPCKDSRQACKKCEEYCLAYKNQPLRGSDGTTGTPAHISRLCERCQTGRNCRFVV